MEIFCEKKKLVLQDIEEVLKGMNLGIIHKHETDELLDTFILIKFNGYLMTILCSLKKDSDYLSLLAGFHPPAPLKRIGAVNKMLKLYNRASNASGLSYSPFYIPPDENGMIYSHHSLYVRYEGLGVPKHIFKRMIDELILGGYYFFPFVMKLFKNNISVKEAFAEFLHHVKEEEEKATVSSLPIGAHFEKPISFYRCF